MERLAWARQSFLPVPWSHASFFQDLIQMYLNCSIRQSHPYLPAHFTIFDDQKPGSAEAENQVETLYKAKCTGPPRWANPDMVFVIEKNLANRAGKNNQTCQDKDRQAELVALIGKSFLSTSLRTRPLERQMMTKGKIPTQKTQNSKA